MSTELHVLKSYAEKYLVAERIRLLGNEPIKTVWFDNIDCRIFVPNALDDRIQTLILNSGRFFEDALLREVKKYIKKDSVVLDIGANIGNHTVFFSKVCQASCVISFEPQKSVFEILKRNVELNSRDDNVVYAHNKGCGSKNSSLSVVHENLGNFGATQFDYDADGGFEVVRLDEVVLPVDQVDFIKIDVERMAHEVLEGARSIITKYKPMIWVELYDIEIEPANRILKELGYDYSKQLAGANYIYTTEPNILE